MKKFLSRCIVTCLMLALAMAATAFYWAFQPILAVNSPAQVFTVDAGSSMRRAANQMAEQGVPVEPTWMWLLARVSGKASMIQAGTYELKAGTTPWELLDKMVSGDVMKETLTIIEGWTFAQMRAAVNAHPALRHDTAQLSDEELMARVAPGYKHPEGLFFPETYVFAPKSSDIVIYRQAFALMQDVLDRAWQSRKPDLPYKTPYEALVMASIIEKETGHELERDMIASVFVNRLRIGMRLQTDPTVIYGMGKEYTGSIRRKHLTTDTPYNTYTRAGLPPTPIALPGRASITAAFNPAQSTSYYFVSRGDGTSHFSPNLQEHNNAVNKYIRKLPAQAPVQAVKPVDKPAKAPAKVQGKTGQPTTSRPATRQAQPNK